jgi:hypothetical protein
MGGVRTWGGQNKEFYGRILEIPMCISSFWTPKNVKEFWYIIYRTFHKISYISVCTRIFHEMILLWLWVYDWFFGGTVARVGQLPLSLLSVMVKSGAHCFIISWADLEHAWSFMKLSVCCVIGQKYMWSETHICSGNKFLMNLESILLVIISNLSQSTALLILWVTCLWCMLAGSIFVPHPPSNVKSERGKYIHHIY